MQGRLSLRCCTEWEGQIDTQECGHLLGWGQGKMGTKLGQEEIVLEGVGPEDRQGFSRNKGLCRKWRQGRNAQRKKVANSSGARWSRWKVAERRSCS